MDHRWHCKIQSRNRHPFQFSINSWWSKFKPFKPWWYYYFFCVILLLSHFQVWSVCQSIKTFTFLCSKVLERMLFVAIPLRILVLLIPVWRKNTSNHLFISLLFFDLFNIEADIKICANVSNMSLKSLSIFSLFWRENSKKKNWLISWT